MAINPYLTLFSLPRGKCSLMKKGKSGQSELMRDITLKGGWETSAQSRCLWASFRIDFAFFRHKKCSKYCLTGFVHWEYAHLASPEAEGIFRCAAALACERICSTWSSPDVGCQPQVLWLHGTGLSSPCSDFYQGTFLAGLDQKKAGLITYDHRLCQL